MTSFDQVTGDQLARSSGGQSSNVTKIYVCTRHLAGHRSKRVRSRLCNAHADSAPSPDRYQQQHQHPLFARPPMDSLTSAQVRFWSVQRAAQSAPASQSVSHYHAAPVSHTSRSKRPSPEQRPARCLGSMDLWPRASMAPLRALLPLSPFLTCTLASHRMGGSSAPKQPASSRHAESSR